jgi:hypothetical protein
LTRQRAAQNGPLGGILALAAPLALVLERMMRGHSGNPVS